MLLGEAQRAGWVIDTVFVAPGVSVPDVDAPVIVLDDGVAERVSDTATPTGLFAIVRTPPRDATTELAHAGFVVACDRVADPGNLGTILRSAEAAGADLVVTTPGTVDPTSPKVVRSSAGALFHVPLVTASLPEAAAAGLRIVGTSSHRGDDHVEADWSGRIAVVVGNEAHGLDDETAVSSWVRIAHAGRAESLNVAMAATLVVFAAARARRDVPGAG